LLIEAYCRAIGMGDIEVGPEGGLFELGDVEIAVLHDADFERLSMLTLVTSVSAGELAQIAPQLLQLNLGLAVSGGQAFCVDVESGEVSLQQSLPLKNLRPEDVDACLSTLAEKTRAARDLLDGLMDMAAITNQEEAASSAEPREDPVFFRL
jgi:hypothetical protein